MMPPATAIALPAELSAQETITRRQRLALAAVVVLLIVGLALLRIVAIQVLIGFAICLYMIISSFKIYVLLVSVRQGTPAYAPLVGDDVPMYSILVPLYREAAVIPGLLDALDALDYPKERLEILLLLEQEDTETIQACRALPAHVHTVVVPPGTPKTKPRACNYGLAIATGDYLVIYDAEDRPEPDQLRKALAGFDASPPEVICLQAKLAYYNQRQNVLTRMFTIDYANWFEGILPGLTRLGVPIPLGGTSNHFRADTLRALGGWDAFNVAEDADLGIRLARQGYRTAIFESVTWEEANSKLRSWLRQRSRWTKGYMQTLLVHTRHPSRLRRELGPINLGCFLALVAGTCFAGLVNPIFWLCGVAYYLTRSTAIEALFVTPVYYLGLFCLVFGNFVFIYMNVYTAVKWGYDGLAKWALLTPIYWILHSIAAYMALYELVVRPHHWHKTTHGLTVQTAATPAQRVANTAAVGDAP